MKKLSVLLTLAASPAVAASGPFFSLHNTNFIVLLAFLLFVAILIYYNVPQMLGEMLDRRAEGIRSELDEARSLREEAQTLLASYERKQKEVQEKSRRIVEHAREEAEIAAAQAKQDLEASIARRLQAAEEQIASAEASAVREVRDRAIAVAVAAASEVIAKQMTDEVEDKLVDDAIGVIETKLH